MTYTDLIQKRVQGGGAPGAPPPPNGREHMILYAQNAYFPDFFFARFAGDSFYTKFIYYLPYLYMMYSAH